jgi:ubiquitin-conjugating enzyme E2 D/E
LGQKWSRTDLPSISAAPQDNNKFVWNVTIMGDLDGGWYENGIYHLTLTFSPDFPEVHPRPKFVTKMFHPQINEDGFPYMSVSMSDSKVLPMTFHFRPSAM